MNVLRVIHVSWNPSCIMTYYDVLCVIHVSGCIMMYYGMGRMIHVIRMYYDVLRRTTEGATWYMYYVCITMYCVCITTWYMYYVCITMYVLRCMYYDVSVLYRMCIGDVSGVYRALYYAGGGCGRMRGRNTCRAPCITMYYECITMRKKKNGGQRVIHCIAHVLRREKKERRTACDTLYRACIMMYYDVSLRNTCITA